MKTTDLCDQYSRQLQVADPLFRHFGGKRVFSGKILTVRCFNDNSKVREILEQEGFGRVLVVDGGGSLQCALLGDCLAGLALKNGWNGIVVNGCIRDSAELAR